MLIDEKKGTAQESQTGNVQIILFCNLLPAKVDFVQINLVEVTLTKDTDLLPNDFASPNFYRRLQREVFLKIQIST